MGCNNIPALGEGIIALMRAEMEAAAKIRAGEAGENILFGQHNGGNSSAARWPEEGLRGTAAALNLAGMPTIPAFVQIFWWRSF